MVRFLPGIVALAFSGHVSACTCSFLPLSTEKVLEAENIFIFRLRSASIERAEHEGMVVGEIDQVETVHGGKTATRTIRFSTSHCCGSRLDVGSYFVAFASGGGTVLEINNGNVLAVRSRYDRAQVRGQIGEIRSGRKELSEVFSRDVLDRIEQSPVLPPCPDHGTGTERVSKVSKRD